MPFAVAKACIVALSLATVLGTQVLLFTHPKSVTENTSKRTNDFD
jgi:hypothetical protein